MTIAVTTPIVRRRMFGAWLVPAIVVVVGIAVDAPPVVAVGIGLGAGLSLSGSV